MYLGVDYYPEHWDKNMIDEDLDNILELNCNVIRIGEFAWHMMESTEGNFDFSYFDRVIEKAKQKGLKVIFGTPTATMPAWLANKYPEVLSEDEFNNKYLKKILPNASTGFIYKMLRKKNFTLNGKKAAGMVFLFHRKIK